MSITFDFKAIKFFKPLISRRKYFFISECSDDPCFFISESDPIVTFRYHCLYESHRFYESVLRSSAPMVTNRHSLADARQRISPENSEVWKIF